MRILNHAQVIKLRPFDGNKYIFPCVIIADYVHVGLAVEIIFPIGKVNLIFS